MPPKSTFQTKQSQRANQLQLQDLRRQYALFHAANGSQGDPPQLKPRLALPARKAFVTIARFFHGVRGESMKKRMLLGILLTVAVCWSPLKQEVTIAPTENLVSDGIAKIPASLAETAGRYGSYRSANFVDWNPAKREMLEVIS